MKKLAIVAVLLLALPVLAEQPAASPDLPPPPSQAAAAPTTPEAPAAPPEAVQAEAAEPQVEVPDAELQAIFAAGGRCGGTTSCGRPFDPTWNAFCNDFCLDNGYLGGACGRARCCLCITEA